MSAVRSRPVYLAGAGKLAQELRQGLAGTAGGQVRAWPGEPDEREPAIVVHAGSGRQLPEILHFCRRTGSVLMELSTGTALEDAAPGHPIVRCPNTNLLMLKFMVMLERSGPLFRGCEVRLTESHQSGKTSVPGTAVALAEALGLPRAAVRSVRDPAEQAAALHIPAEHLARHAFHRIELRDAACQIVMETRVTGDASYVAGVQQLLAAVQAQVLQPRVYPVTEFIENGWV